MRNWELLVTLDPLQAMEEVQHALSQGEVSEAMDGIKEFIETMSQQDINTVESFLSLIMLHILKWKTQPEKRTKSWIFSIENGRREIAKRKAKRPSITDKIILNLWQEAFEDARFRAANEMDMELIDISTIPPTWDEVFHQEYKKTEIPPFFQ